MTTCERNTRISVDKLLFFVLISNLITMRAMNRIKIYIDICLQTGRDQDNLLRKEM
jgi:hypothetical protein